jgi:hypothetical protein
LVYHLAIDRLAVAGGSAGALSATASLDLSGLFVRSPSWQAGIQENMLSTGPQG